MNEPSVLDARDTAAGRPLRTSPRPSLDASRGPSPGHSLGPVAQIPAGEGRLFVAGNRTVAVFHLRDGQVRATDPWCPHRGGPLADGLVGAGTVTCPFHGFRFDLTSGCAVGHECPPIATYPVSVDAAGQIHLHLE